MTKRYVIGIGLTAVAALAATVALGAFAPVSSHQDDPAEYPPLPLPPSQVQAKTLFTIPYGTEEHQVCDFRVGPGEGESALYTPVAFRRLANGHFALLASRPNGGRLQIFNERGELVKSAPMDVNPERGAYHIRSDGMVFWVNPMMMEYAIGIGRREAGILDDEPTEAQPRKPGEPYCIPPEIAVKMPLLIVQASDPAQRMTAQSIQERIRLQFAEAYSEYHIEEILDGIFATDDNTVYVSVLLPPSSEGNLAEVGTVCMRQGRRPQVTRLTGWEYLTLPDGSVGYGFVAPLDSQYNLITEDSKLIVHRFSDNSTYAEFKIHKGLSKVSPMPVTLKFLSPERLVADFRGIIVVLDREGNVIFHDRTNPRYCKLACDVDSQGNLYYLNFTKNGVEVRMAAVGR